MMDKKVIKKAIEYYSNSCPRFKYENPLLDRNIADFLIKSFIKLLNEQHSESHRSKILTNICKSCCAQPPDHVCDRNIKSALKNFYEKLPDDNSIDKELDAFLIRYLKEMNIDPLYPSSLKSDILRALITINNDKQYINNVLVKDIIHWNVDGKENSYEDILDTIWNTESVGHLCKSQPDDISIKAKGMIEEIILRSALEMINTVILDEDDWFTSNNDLMQLVAICCISNECFQISCAIMNALFIRTKFDLSVRQFISLFINSVIEINSTNLGHRISQLYPDHLKHIVLLLDINWRDLPEDIQTSYVAHTIKQLNSLRAEYENDLIMLLSHFYHWFHVYYDSNKK